MDQVPRNRTVLPGFTDRCPHQLGQSPGDARAGIEPALCGVAARRLPVLAIVRKCRGLESNQLRAPLQGAALPVSYTGRTVDAGRIELPSYIGTSKRDSTCVAARGAAPRSPAGGDGFPSPSTIHATICAGVKPRYRTRTRCRWLGWVRNHLPISTMKEVAVEGWPVPSGPRRHASRSFPTQSKPIAPVLQWEPKDSNLRRSRTGGFTVRCRCRLS